MFEVLAALRRHAKDRPDAAAFRDDANQVTYAELEGMSAAVAFAAAQWPGVTAILAPNGIEWAAAWLGLARAGKTVVALPPFFSGAQLAHIVKDSGAARILTAGGMEKMAAPLGLPCHAIAPLTAGERGEGPDDPEQVRQACQIVYTSGTTGAPKGVRLGSRQVDWSAAALNRAVGANADDHYLSVLPFALLLEQICGICAPLLAGAPVTVAGHVAASLMAGNPQTLVAAVEQARPTVSVLVPEFLTAWVAVLRTQGGRAPESLRAVAVGGAPVAPALAEGGRALGIPVLEGYGLSECCSVVSVNRPGDCAPGTTGKPLDGLDVQIVDGEIVVSGPSVMDGYLHHDNIGSSWPTGDLGSFDEQGNLIVHGRKDKLIVLANGRNVSPEWIEAMILADPRIASCVLDGHGESHLRANLTPSPVGQAWFAGAGEEEVRGLIESLCRTAPAYARPGGYRLVEPASPA